MHILLLLFKNEFLWYFEEICNMLAKKGLAFLGCLLFLYIHYLIFCLIWTQFNILLAIAVYFFCFYLLAWNAARIAIFPGSCFIYLRLFERDREQFLAKSVLHRISNFKSSLIAFTDFISTSINYREALDALVNSKNRAKHIIKQLQQNAAIQMRNQELTSDQSEFTTFLNQLSANIKSTKILINGSQEIQISKLSSLHYSNLPSVIASFPNLENTRTILTCCTKIEECLQKVLNPDSKFEQLKYICFKQTLGHLAYSRAETFRQLNSERIKVESTDNTILDGIIIHCGEPNYNSSMPNNEENNAQSRSLVIFFNPNAGFYEFAADYQIHWIKFYQRLGFDILFWNYRGYGESNGWPNPCALIQDGEVILKYAKTRGYTRTVLHGESLGGAIATILADKIGCDFLFADRTFGSLTRLAQLNVGKIPSFILKKVTQWSIEAAESYVNANCYKVIANDVDDKMIYDLASLRSNVSQYIVFFNIGILKFTDWTYGIK